MMSVASWSCSRTRSHGLSKGMMAQAAPCSSTTPLSLCFSIRRYVSTVKIWSDSSNFHGVRNHHVKTEMKHSSQDQGCVARAHAPVRRAVKAMAGAVDQASNVRIQVQGRHIEVTPSIHDYAMKKVASSVEPFKSGVRNVDIRFSVRGGDAGKGEKQQKVELTARTAHHGVIRAEVIKDDLYAAIDVTADKLARSLRKLKEKAVARGNWAGGRGGEKGSTHISDVAPVLASVDYDVAPSDDEVEKAKSPLDLPDSVKRTKVFYLDEMSVADAIDKLQFVDHDFYIYLDEDSGHVQVVYKRKTEGFGVIITVADEAD